MGDTGRTGVAFWEAGLLGVALLSTPSTWPLVMRGCHFPDLYGEVQHTHEIDRE